MSGRKCFGGCPAKITEVYPGVLVCDKDHVWADHGNYQVSIGEPAASLACALRDARAHGPATRKVIETLKADVDCEERLVAAGCKSATDIGAGVSSWFSFAEIRAFIAEHEAAAGDITSG